MFELKLSCFGPPQVRLSQQLVDGFRSRKELALLLYLAVENGRAHSRESLAGLLWSESSTTEARNNLRVVLSRLRKLLNAHQSRSLPILQTSRTTIQFVAREDIYIDVHEFESLTAEVDSHGHDSDRFCDDCQTRLTQAVALYQGEFLEGFFLEDSERFEEWMFTRRERYSLEILRRLGTLTDLNLQANNPAAAQGYAQRQLELNPLHESAYRQMMLALAVQREFTSALSLYERCQRTLATELNVDPMPETSALAQQIHNRDLSSAIPALASSTAQQHESTGTALSPSPHDKRQPKNGDTTRPLHNLHRPLTPFLGREDELAQLQERLNTKIYRLITIVGPGGMGKSRLALEAAYQQIGEFRDGVFMVTLAQVRAVDEIPAAIANAMGASFVAQERSPVEQLVHLLRSRHLLLVLDNFEHLITGENTAGNNTADEDITGVDLLLDILQNAPDLMLLITSRERLHIQAEDLFNLHGLALPPVMDDNGEPRQIDSFASVRLFVERAQRVRKTFELTEINGPAIRRICQLVDGIPLAIELAATWIDDFSCDEIAQELTSGLDILSTTMRDVPTAHRSMKTVFESSWRLLSEDEQRVLAQLSVFRGGFSREAAKAVTGASHLRLRQLSYKSLLQNLGTGRFDIHELLRQFASEKLTHQQSGGGYHKACQAHSQFYLDFIAKRTHLLYQEVAKESAQEILVELDNVRSGWQWAVNEGDHGLLQKSLRGLAHFCLLMGYWREGEQIFVAAATISLEHYEHMQEKAYEELAGQLLVEAGNFQAHMKQFISSDLTLQEAMALTSNSCCLARAYARRGGMAAYQGYYKEGRELVEKGVALADAGQCVESKIGALIELGFAELVAGESDKAEVHFQEAISAAKTNGLIYYLKDGLWHIYCLKADQNQFSQSIFYLEEFQQVVKRLGDRRGEFLAAHGWCITYHMVGYYKEAVEIGESGRKIAQEVGDTEFESFMLHMLCDCYREIGKYEQAEKSIQKSMAQAEAHDSPRAKAFAFYYEALLRIDQEELIKAQINCQEACSIYRQLEKYDSLIEPLALFAHIELLLGQPENALAKVNEILNLLDGQPIAHIDQPLRAYWYCYLVLHANRDNRAKEVLAEGVGLLIRWADDLADPSMRRSFMENVDVNRALMAEWQVVGKQSESS